MNKNAKMVIIGLIIFLALTFIGKMMDVLGEGDNKCDFCGAPAGIQKGTTEYCGDCFAESEEKF